MLTRNANVFNNLGRRRSELNWDSLADEGINEGDTPLINTGSGEVANLLPQAGADPDHPELFLNTFHPFVSTLICGVRGEKAEFSFQFTVKVTVVVWVVFPLLAVTVIV
jgi:hypothetical protein